MNKGRLAEHVAQSLEISNARAAVVTDHVLDAIIRAIVTDGRVQLTGLGTLEILDRDARTARNPQTGEPVEVPARKTVKLRAGTKIQKYLNGEEDLPADRMAIHKAPRS